MTVRDAWGPFQENELRDPEVARSATTIQCYLECFKCQGLPEWGDRFRDEVKTVSVEKWLRPLKSLAPATKTKIRNHMSALFSHCIRWDIYDKPNPIAEVRQSAKRQRDPDILETDELQCILSHIDQDIIRVIASVAASSALRRSEVRDLKWRDLDFNSQWFNLRRGMVRKDETNLKRQAFRKGVPMLPE